MAATSKVMPRLCSRIQPLAVKLSKPSLSLELSPLKATSQSQLHASARRISRLPVELSNLGSMIPLHNAVASARLVSSLSIESRGWGLVPQGALVHLTVDVFGGCIAEVGFNNKIV